MNFLSRLRPAGCAVVLVFLPTLRLAAADAHILPEGAGTKDGSSWENARPGTVGDFQAAWEALTPGDTLHVGSGTYAEIALAVSHGGAARNPVRLKGVDLGGGPPKFVSSFDRNNPGSTGKVFFQAAPGVSWFEIEGLKLENYQTGFRFPGRNTNIRIANIGMESFREGLRSESSPSSGALSEWCHNVIVEDCRFVNFTKRAIRLQGGNCHWTIRRCFADAGGREWFTEPFAICFQVVGDDAKRKAKQGGAHDHHITFADCVALNTYHEKSGGYWNGDGFCAERGTSHLRYERCYAAGHTDAGWDDKSEGPQLVDCIAVDNKRNYRFWGRDVTLSNCVSAFARKRGGRGGATGLWSGGEVEAVDCTFFDDDGPPFSVDGEKPDSRISLKNCLVVSVPPGRGGAQDSGPSTDRLCDREQGRSDQRPANSGATLHGTRRRARRLRQRPVRHVQGLSQFANDESFPVMEPSGYPRGMVPSICRLSDARRETRWFSAENPTGRPGGAHEGNDGRKRQASVDLPPGGRLELARVDGESGIIRRIWLTFFGLRLQDCPHFLRGLRLEVVYDDAARPAVNAPVGDFFCQGLGRATAFENAFFSSPEGRSLVSCLPMPFRKGVRMTLVNDSPFLCRKVYYEVDATVGDDLPADVGYLHAHWRREPRTRMMQDYAILPRVTGRGRYVGACVSVLPDRARYGPTWWGEGEVKIYLDGDRERPTLCGTGTEDYIGTGWGQQRFAQLYQGSPIAEKNALEFAYAFYRLHGPDPVDFHREIRVTIQQIGSWSRVEDLRAVLEKRTDLRLKGGEPFVPPAKGPPPSFSHFEREDDWSSLCWFYLDRPENDLPPPAPYEERVARLAPNFLRKWRVAGPFPGTADGAVHLDDAPPFDFNPDLPLLGADASAWRPAEARVDGFVDLAAALEPKDWVFAFAVAEFDSPVDQEVTLAFSADDGIRLWLNGDKVAESEGTRHYSQTLPDRVVVSLRAGRNRIAAKITNHTLGWGFGVGFLGHAGPMLP